MLWPILFGKSRAQPVKGRWGDWKQAIADHCDGRCVYCAIPEGRFGGIRNFHVEHFRPKAKFPALENEINNLYLACAICNVLKGDDWPAEPEIDHTRATYPDPSLVDYNTILLVLPNTHEVSSDKQAGKYLIERILLNRAQLIIERRLAAMLQFLSEFEAWVTRCLDDMTPAERQETIVILLQIGNVTTAALQARPYLDVETKRIRRAKGVKQR